ncbi:MAG TPA: SDR family NAD(P)-dependent oxidoreductase, partial [Chromatiales bacterium]|nr:SDR family NAD(P)-dependent oxidoreductase [Chromatiales bacterium]
MATRFAGEGMKVVLADVERDSLQAAAEELRGRGGEVLAVTTDVGREDEVRSLAEQTLDRYGAVDLLCNNAGVFAGGLAWQSPRQDYEWLMNVNVWGVVHGVR